MGKQDVYTFIYIIYIRHHTYVYIIYRFNTMNPANCIVSKIRKIIQIDKDTTLFLPRGHLGKLIPKNEFFI